MKLINPAPGRKVTSPYGPRTHPITGQSGKMHHGIDFGGSFDVLAAGDGIINHVGWSPKGGGHVVIIQHATKLFTVYYHGKHATRFKVGDRIKAGEVVYKSGSTGASTGNHLHFEVRRSKKWGDSVDPNIYINSDEPGKPNSVGGPTTPTYSLKVTGKLDKSTWAAWQNALKDSFDYRGIVDGLPGKLTWSAVQRSGIKFGYNAKNVDGIPGPNTRKAVQRRLKASGDYRGAIDGIWGQGTISALQRSLNKGSYK
jgi:hypothetical protein